MVQYLSIVEYDLGPIDTADISESAKTVGENRNAKINKNLNTSILLIINSY